MVSINNTLKTLSLKRVIYIPVKNNNGINKDKVLMVIEGGTIHKKLLQLGVKLSNICVIE